MDTLLDKLLIFSLFYLEIMIGIFFSLARAAAVAFALAGAGMLYYEHLNRFNWRQRYFDAEIVYEVFDDDDVAGMLYYEHLNRFNWRQIYLDWVGDWFWICIKYIYVL